MRARHSFALLVVLAVPLLAVVVLLTYVLGGLLGAAFAAAVVTGFGFLAFDGRRFSNRLAAADATERERIVVRTQEDTATWGKAMTVLFLGFPVIVVAVLLVWGVIAAMSALR